MSEQVRIYKQTPLPSLHLNLKATWVCWFVLRTFQRRPFRVMNGIDSCNNCICICICICRGNWWQLVTGGVPSLLMWYNLNPVSVVRSQGDFFYFSPVHFLLEVSLTWNHPSDFRQVIKALPEGRGSHRLHWNFPFAHQLSASVWLLRLIEQQPEEPREGH